MRLAASLTLAAVTLAAIVTVACAGRDPASPGRPPPPRLPGESITRSQLCTCKACSPSSCCEDEGLSAPDDTGGMGLAVTSCEPRCRQEAWRVWDHETCDVKRPADCCAE
jgi:hypothetical protein